MFTTLIALSIINCACAFPFLLDVKTSFNVSSFLPSITTPNNTSAILSQQLKECFEPRAGRSPIDERDCHLAAHEMNKDFDSYPDYIIFGRQPSAQLKLPKSYHAGSCMIYLDMVLDEDQDSIPSIEVTDDTVSLIGECVGGPDWPPDKPHLAGVIGVGKRQLLYVVVQGRDLDIPRVS